MAIKEWFSDSVALLALNIAGTVVNISLSILHFSAGNFAAGTGFLAAELWHLNSMVVRRIHYDDSDE